jgi:hypothetical protein
MTRFNCDICGFSMPIHQNSVGREIVCPRCQQKSLVAAQLTRKEETSPLVKIVFSLFVIAVFVAVLQGILGNVNQSNSSSNTPAKRLPLAGGLAVISCNPGTYVCADEKAQKELYSFINAKNNNAIASLILSGRVFVCDNGTKVTVLESGVFTCRIRVMEGNHIGREGILASEFLASL